MQITHFENRVQDQLSKSPGKLLAIWWGARLAELARSWVKVPASNGHTCYIKKLHYIQLGCSCQSSFLTCLPKASSSCPPLSCTAQLVPAGLHLWQQTSLRTSQQTASKWRPIHAVQTQSQQYRQLDQSKSRMLKIRFRDIEDSQSKIQPRDITEA